MQLTGSSNSFGQVALIVSPPENVVEPSSITFSLSIKIREMDKLPYFRVHVYTDYMVEYYTYAASTIGFQSVSFCVTPGRIQLALEAVWGMYSSPLIAVDNVTIIPENFCNRECIEACHRVITFPKQSKNY